MDCKESKFTLMSLSEINQTTTEVVFGRDPTSAQADFMGNHSGVPLTKQSQLDMYIELRLKNNNPDCDQVVYARVLAKTGGSVDEFKKEYPHILFPIGLES
jgi:hypothetical protein